MNRFRTLVAVAAGLWMVAAAAVFFTAPGPNPVIRFLVATAGTLAIAGTALLAFLFGGLAFLRATGLEPGDPSVRAIAAVGAGLGLFQVIVLILGGAGGLSLPVAWGLLLAFLAAGIRPAAAELPGLARDVMEALRRMTLFERVLLAFAAVVTVLSVLYAFVPPVGYDDLEYHLGGPKAWWQAGRVGFLSGNVYTNFPSGMEMVSYFFMTATEDPLGGATLARLVNIALLLLTGALVLAWAEERLGRDAAWPAAVFFIATPWTALLAMECNTEPGQAFFSALTLYAFSRGVFPIEGDAGRCRRWLALAGLAAGFAAGCKYPVLLFLHLPLVLMIPYLVWRRRMDAAGAAGFLVLSVAGLLPWLVRNYVNTGNPVYPFAYALFAGDPRLEAVWSAAQAARFQAAHAAGGWDPAGMPGRLWGYIVASGWMSAVYAAFLPLLLLRLVPGGGRGERKGIPAWLGFLIVYAGVYYVIWDAATHRVDRFLFPVIPVLALLAGAGFAAAAAVTPARLAAVAAVGLLVPALFRTGIAHVIEDGFRVAFGVEDERVCLARKMKGSTWSPEVSDAVNALPPGSCVLFVGEARTFHTGPRVIAATVFDRNPLEEALTASGSARDVRDRLRARGVTHVYFNEAEMERLARTYAYEFQGERRAGLEISRTGLLREFGDGFLEPVTSFAGTPDGPVRHRLYKIN
ncbi:MAG: glycosyltransferase family 39 protein [Planctomycetota bacterium]